MEPDGIAALVERSGGLVVVRDLEVAEDLRMAFGEGRCLAAFRDFLASVESGAEKVRFEGVRGGSRMMLARHGYVPDRDAMVGPGGGAATASRRLDPAKRLKELERENARLKKLRAEQALDNAILKEAASGNF